MDMRVPFSKARDYVSKEVDGYCSAINRCAGLSPSGYVRQGVRTMVRSSHPVHKEKHLQKAGKWVDGYCSAINRCAGLSTKGKPVRASELWLAPHTPCINQKST